MRVLLLSPPGAFSSKEARPSLGLLSLAATLAEAGFEVEVLDGGLLGVSWRGLRRQLRAARYGLVGISVLTEARFASFRAAAEARRLQPEAFVVAGGPQVTPCAEETLEDVPPLDAVIPGEADRVVVELALARARGTDVREVRGLVCRDGGGRPRRTPPAEPITDLEALPLPARDKIPDRRRRFLLEVPGRGRLPAEHLVTSRGCPFDCSFCATPRTSGRRWRARSAESVLAEVDLLVAGGARALWFHDDNLNLDRARLAAICEGLLARGGEVPWCGSARAELLDLELLRLMKRAGCFRLFFGVETATPRLREEVLGKRAPLETILRASEWMDQVGIQKNPGYIIGLPGETPAEARATLELMRAIGGEPTLSALRIYPGTRIEAEARARGILPPDFRWSVPDERPFLVRAAFGEAPLFLDQLTWGDFCALAAEWVGGQKGWWRKGARAAGQVKTAGDAARLVSLGWSVVKARLRRRTTPTGGVLGGGKPARHSRLGKAVAYWRAWGGLVRGETSGNAALPRKLWLDLSSRCNLHCPRCPNHQLQTRGDLPLETCRSLLEQAAALGATVNLHHRGESLLHPDFAKIARAAQNAGVLARLHTNGTLLSPATARLLLAASLAEVSLSLDGFDAETYRKNRPGGDFAQVVANARQLLRLRGELGARGVRVVVQVIAEDPAAVTNGTRDAFLRLFSPYRPDRVQVKAPHDWAGAVNLPASARDQEEAAGRGGGCVFPWYALCVLSDGRVAPCPQDFFGELSLGLVGSESLQGIWRGEKARALREAHVADRRGNPAPLPEICRRCALRRRGRFLGLPRGPLGQFLRESLRDVFAP